MRHSFHRIATLPLYLYAPAHTVDVLSYTAWVLSEAIVVGVTLAATRHHKSLAGALGRGQTSLSAVLFRNGTLDRWHCRADDR